ncbi:MAG: PAS domain-containing protein [Anaerolineaceae bacterium]|nr:PAS domain-containing protein [Anaerolineaceae bacterium]
MQQKLRFQFRSLWPIFLVVAVCVIAFAALFPPIVRTIQQHALEVGEAPSVKPLLLLLLATLAIGLMCGLAVNIYNANERFRVLENLKAAVEELGVGKFREIYIPKHVGEMPEMKALGDAIRTTAHKAEDYIATLKKQKNMLSVVLSNMTDGVLIADEDGSVQLLNKAAENFFNVKSEIALNKPISEVIKQKELMELWNKTKTGKPETITLEFGQEPKFMQAVGISLEEDLPGRSMLLFQDLSHTYHLDAVRRDFVSNVSHELRTPVAGLKAITETLLDGALDDPLVARKFVSRMDSEVDNLTLMINELLELSRIEAGEYSFYYKPARPIELIVNAVDRMTLQAERAGIKLSFDCPDDLPKILADPSRVSQVFINLIQNAIKFTPEGGHIHLTAQIAGPKVLFSVRDDGTGIIKRDRNRIFERFYKADRARTGGGTGLGLSICKHIVEEHGGHIWVESEVGHGSTFYFSLPVVHEPDSKNKNTKEAQSEG